MYRYGITYRTCLLDDWFFVVQLKPLEEHLVSNVLVARSSSTGAQCHLCNLHYSIFSLNCLYSLCSWIKLRSKIDRIENTLTW